MTEYFDAFVERLTQDAQGFMNGHANDSFAVFICITNLCIKNQRKARGNMRNHWRDYDRSEVLH